MESWNLPRCTMLSNDMSRTSQAINVSRTRVPTPIQLKHLNKLLEPLLSHDTIKPLPLQLPLLNNLKWNQNQQVLMRKVPFKLKKRNLSQKR